MKPARGSRGQSFPRQARLTTRSEFLSVSRQGIKVHTPHFIIIRKANDEGRDRLGVTVSARVGKAVARNRVKRLLRELFRRRRSKSRPHQDIVVIAKRGAAELSLERIAAELRGN